MQRLAHRELSRRIIAMLVRDRLSGLRGASKASAYAELVSFFLDENASRSRIPYKTAIDAESNLSSTILREISWCLGVDYAPYESKEKLIDSRLLARRNTIAHGDWLSIDESDYDELHGNVIEMLNTLRNQLDNAASTGCYLRS
jgi:hypothetical protein